MKWIFGYGSIIWRPSFTYATARPALLRGWRRRFWQGSPDHRGTPGAPGRVVTLVEDPAASCWGLAFDIGGQDPKKIILALDRRESGGYVRLPVEVEFSDQSTASALTYFAPPGNDNYLGPASLSAIAAQVSVCIGDSGHNVEYVIKLADALRKLDMLDEEVHSLETKVRQLVD